MLVFNSFLFIVPVHAQTVEPPVITGEKWKDTDGNFINAHGAGILYYNDTYYLFGEIKTYWSKIVGKISYSPLW